MELDGKETILHENQSSYIPNNSKHRLSNAGEKVLKIIEVQSGSYLGEDDIERFDDNYGRVWINKMKVFLTGACGFIGFHLCKKLIQKGCQVIGIDNFNSYYDPKLKEERYKELSKKFK